MRDASGQCHCKSLKTLTSCLLAPAVADEKLPAVLFSAVQMLNIFSYTYLTSIYLLR